MVWVAMLSRVKDALWVDVTEVIGVEAIGVKTIKLYLKSGDSIIFNDHNCDIATPTLFMRFKQEQESLRSRGRDIQANALGAQDT